MPLSPEQIAEIQEALVPALEAKMQETIVSALGRPLNDAISKRLGQFEKTFGGTVESSISKAIEGLKAQTPAPQGDGNQRQQDPKDPNAVALKTVETKLADALARLDDADRRVAAERSKNRNTSLTDTVKDHLAKLGIVDPVAQRLAVSHLVLADKRVQYESDEDDARPLFVGEDGAPVDLSTGLKKWSTSPEAKHFLPAIGALGSGANPPQRSQLAPIGQKLSVEQQREAVGNALADALNASR